MYIRYACYKIDLNFVLFLKNVLEFLYSSTVFFAGDQLVRKISGRRLLSGWPGHPDDDSCVHPRLTWVAAQAGHYAALGVAVDFGAAAELRKAYKRASLAAHPDRGGSADAFAKVAAAHDTLRHAAARAGYDLGDDLPRGAHRAAERDARPRPTASWPAPRGSSAVRCGLTPSGPFRAGAQEDGSEGPPLPEV